MGFLANLFRKKTENEEKKVGGIEDFMTLIRVYYQAVMAGNLGISNINMLPDLAMFKRTLKVATQNNKLGIAEKSRCKKMLMQIYGLNESFFKEDAEKALYANLQKFNDNVDYKTYLNELENLNPSVTKFFDDVLVMDKDENVKKNRLALLTLLRKKYDFLTDFSKI